MDGVFDLMNFNVGRARGKGVFIVSSCIVDNYPDVVESLVGDGDVVVLKVCPESTHINMIGYKVLSIIEYSDVDEVTVLSVDGSFHCVQLQYVLEDINRHFVPSLKVRHLVLEKGKVFEISQESVRVSRHLSKVEKLRKRVGG